MQSIEWYRRRLTAMSAGEVAWRARSTARDLADRILFPLARRRSIVPGRNGDTDLVFPVDERVLGNHLSVDQDCRFQFSDSIRTRLVSQADAVLQHRVVLFGSWETHLGPQTDWNYDYKSATQTPMGFAPAIDYRDFETTGDCKWVWELNRCHHLVVLGRAYRATGDRRYAREALVQIQSWMDQCPFGLGMNWRSPLELAVRLMNWVWTLELIRPSGLLSGRIASRILQTVDRHLWEISRKYSRYSSANNHLVGEAAGVFIGSAYFQGLPGSAERRRHSREILLREIQAQTYNDGVHRELALGYHLFTLEFFLLCGLCAKNIGEDFPEPYWLRLEKMLDFAAAVSEGGRPPTWGDCDDGYVLDLGGVRGDARRLLAVGAVVFGRGDFKTLSEEMTEPVYWLLGQEGLDRFKALPQPQAEPPASRAFPESGLYLLQCGDEVGEDSISVTFDCADLGFESIAAHGHADALSFTLRVGGVEMIVDPGTYDYFTDRAWRDYFRSTRAHNTVEIDGLDQSQMLGPFLWGRRAGVRCNDWESSGEVTTVTGEHDGYHRLDDPVTHRRTITLERTSGEVRIEDEIIAQDAHWVALYFHFAEDCLLESLGGNRYAATCTGRRIEIIFDGRLELTTVKGGTHNKLGWVSRAYHQKAPSATMVGRMKTEGSVRLSTGIKVRSAEALRRERCVDVETAANIG